MCASREVEYRFTWTGRAREVWVSIWENGADAAAKQISLSGTHLSEGLLHEKVIKLSDFWSFNTL